MTALSKMYSMDLKTVHFYVALVGSEDVDKEVYSVGYRSEGSSNHRQVRMRDLSKE